jgi:hypothetical protein
MTFNINWSIIPTHTIDGGKLREPYDISRIMKSLKIDKYLYRIMYKGIVLKFGMSADNSRHHGERVYRQIGHSRSWDAYRLTGSSGADWRIIEEDFKNLYGFEIDIKFIKIKIWDVSNYPFRTINPRNEIIDMENQLIENYVSVVGEKPIGNINDEANIIKKAFIKTETWDGLFDIENTR